jgi:radical SAM superfamily enzyme YgiQ (UPF0313 family)
LKVLFVNAPVIRSADSSPENDFKVSGLVFHPRYRKVPGARRIYRNLRKLGIGRSVRYGVRAGSRWPWTMDQPHGGPHFPFLLAYAASSVKAAGHQVVLFDAVAEEEYSYERALRRIEAEAADIVVVECSTPTIDIDTWFARRIARFTEVALAGAHLTSNATEVQASFPEIRYLLKGEYVLSALEMVRTRRPGIYESTVVRDLDAIPFPFRSFPAASSYYDSSMPTATPQLQVWGGKGCPFKCTYCLWPQTMYGGAVALRAPERIAAEIRECVAEGGYRSIFFDDDTFNLGNDRVARLCDELKAIGLPWTMMGRLDCSPDWLYDKMVDSGCVGMRFGVETFDLEVLARVKKGLERTDFRSTLEHLTRRHPQLVLHLTMMKSLPGQTAESHAADMRTLAALGFSPTNRVRSVQVAACAPFPGTVLYDQLVAKVGKEALADFRKYDGSLETVMADMGAGDLPPDGTR